MSTPEFTPAPPTPPLPACPVAVPAHLLALRPAKVRDHHLDRKAIVPIRQSSPQQVAEHKESTARQYALADVAVALGWPRDRIEIIDADPGHTGQTVEGRHGFQYLLAELGLDHVAVLKIAGPAPAPRRAPPGRTAPPACSTAGTTARTGCTNRSPPSGT